LITTGKRLNILRPHFHLPHPADRYGQGSGDCRRGQTCQGRSLVVGNQLDPLVVIGDESFDIRQRQIPVQLDGHSLTVAAHCTDPDTDAVNRNRRGGAEDLVGLGKAFPLLAALTILNLAVDPGEHVARQRIAEFLLRQRITAQAGSHFTVYIQDGR